jgi:YjbE family integral membrane protein
MEIGSTEFFVALLQIIWIDLVLSGDNAVVIALACRSLPEKQRRWGIILGAGTAIGLRVIFAIFIIYLLGVPYLKIVGGLLLLWIAVKLVLPEEEAEGGGVAAGTTLFAAIRTIAIADAVMSLDNVIAIAAASHGSVLLLTLGLLISIPCIVFGSTMILTAIDRFPVLIYAGAGLLGWIAGHMLLTDPAVLTWLGEEQAHGLELPAKIAGATLVIVGGYLLGRSIRSRREKRGVEIATSTLPEEEAQRPSERAGAAPRS